MPGYKWHPITDFEADPKTLTDGEMISLRKVWEDQRQDMREQGTLDEFNKRLWREWSIETGIIERVYTLDRGVTQTLIAKGIDAALIPHRSTDRDPILVARIIQDHYDALEGIFDFVGGQRELSTSYVKELHAALLRNQDSYTVEDQLGRVFEKPLEKGTYKADPNSPKQADGSLHEYCPPEHVASEMDRLVEMFTAHRTPVEVEAAWLHHRFAQIHPFADGNGRVARALASLVFIKARWFPLVIKREDWTRYIDALEKADAGDLRLLIRMFVEAQKAALIQASEIVYDLQPIRSVDDAVVAIRERLAARGVIARKEWLAAKHVASLLTNAMFHRFGQLANQLTQEIAAAGRGFSFNVGQSDGVPLVLEAMAGRAGHTVDLSEPTKLTILEFNAVRACKLTVAFYALGPKFRGLIGCVAYFETEDSTPSFLDDGAFQINYAEDPKEAQARFTQWLERVIVNALNAWRRTL
jgi:fido (protein-threonine AMPylation protein)